MNLSLSVIIPTHKRTDILRQCLECLAKQTILTQIEVIVVSDGPDERTAEMIQSLSWPFALQYFAIPKSQQGVARNRAVEKARAPYCLLLGDDIFLARDACEKHLDAHAKLQDPNSKFQTSSNFRISKPQPQPLVVVLGFTTWDPTLRITPVMRWMEKSGVQFGYPKIQQYAHDFIPVLQQHFFTYTSNLSLPSKLLYQNKFLEGLSLYGWEDIEWGKRLAAKGISLFYESDARGYHHHAFTDREVFERSEKLGISAVEMERLVPGLILSPRGWKKTAYCFRSLLPTYWGRHCRAFLRGMREAMARRRSQPQPQPSHAACANEAIFSFTS